MLGFPLDLAADHRHGGGGQSIGGSHRGGLVGMRNRAVRIGVPREIHKHRLPPLVKDFTLNGGGQNQYIGQTSKKTVSA